MKGLIQVEIRAFAFSNTPILQYSNTPKQLAIYTGNSANGGTDLALGTGFSILNK